MHSHQIRTTSRVQRSLGRLADDLGPHFTATTSCLSCAQEIATAPATALVALTESLGVVQLAHARCSPSLVRNVDVLPLATQSGYEYKTLLLPVDNGGQPLLVPTIVVRLGIDTLFVQPDAQGNWQPSPGRDLEAAGFARLEGELAVADESCSLQVEGDNIHVDLPGGQDIDVQDSLLPERIQEMGSVLVMHLGEGSVHDITDMNSLARTLRRATTLAALVDISDTNDSTEDNSAEDNGVIDQAPVSGDQVH